MEYVTDERGERTKVILDIEEYERVMAAIRSGEEERAPFGRKSDRS